MGLHLFAIVLMMFFISPDSPNKVRYREPQFSVKTKYGIPFAEVNGYWTTLEENTYSAEKIFKMGQATTERTLDLRLDLYLPKNDTLTHRPLIMLMHGGSFYYGSRKDNAIIQWCRHFASLGYVTASIDYRIGFVPSMQNIERAGYRALQDAHAALRFLVANQEKYGIDTSLIFVGGTSSGAITALNLAYLTNETRPVSTYDLGNIETSGNNLTNEFSIKGIVDMWGAITDTCLMKGHQESILAFHGDADNTVSYGYDYPLGIAGDIRKLLTNKMYGSYCIVNYAKKHGQKAKLYTLKGLGHAPHKDRMTLELNKNFYFIQDKMTEFLYQIIEQEKQKKNYNPN